MALDYKPTPRPSGVNNRSNEYYERRKNVRISKSEESRSALGGSAPVILDDFIFTVETTTPDETFTIPCVDIGVFDAVVQSDTAAEPHLSGAPVIAFDSVNLVLTFPSAGTHTITISGTFPNVRFVNSTVDRAKLRTVENLGRVGWLNLQAAFNSCNQMTAFNGAGETPQLTALRDCFRGCSLLSSIEGLGTWDVSNVSTFQGVFWGSGIVTPPDIGGWRNNFGNLDSMFRDCTKLVAAPDLSSWDMSNSIVPRFMFQNCPVMATAPDTRAWNTGTMTNISGMFNGCLAITSNPGPANWDISNMSTMTSFMLNSAMTTEEYDQLLINWAAQTVQPNVSVSFGSSQYTPGGAAEAARDVLTGAPNNWTIDDGGPVT